MRIFLVNWVAKSAYTILPVEMFMKKHYRTVALQVYRSHAVGNLLQTRAIASVRSKVTAL